MLHEKSEAGSSLQKPVEAAARPSPLSAPPAHPLASMSPGEAAHNLQSIKAANATTGGYQSPFASVGLSGITNDQSDAEDIARRVGGDVNPHGYAAYGRNKDTYKKPGELGPTQPGLKSDTPKDGGALDTVTDLAAVTQYAAAADLAVKLGPNAKGTGQQVKIDWEGMSQMKVSAKSPLTGKVEYDDPKQVANNGYQAAMADIAKKGGKADDKDQFISLTGHSGGGQSSFYTALKLSSEGYKNVSVVGVDMAMTPHERQVLEAMGVKVTNITSNSKKTGGGQTDSTVGEVIRDGMGGGQNYYDLNVQRQTNDLGALKNATDLHGVKNDANVMTTVRFAQYLDATGQHGNYSPALYAKFLADTNNKGNKESIEEGAKDKKHDVVHQADQDLFTNQAKVKDLRQLPGAEANKGKAGGATMLEFALNQLDGQDLAKAGHAEGAKVHAELDIAGAQAQAAIQNKLTQVGSQAGATVHNGMDALGSKVNTAGQSVHSTLDQAGASSQSMLNRAAGATQSLGTAADNKAHAVSNKLSSAGNTVGNGFDNAGHKASSLLGHIPWVGSTLGNVADKGMHLLGSGARGASNLTASGVDHLGHATQSVLGVAAKGEQKAGSLLHNGLDAAGSGVEKLGGMTEHALDKSGAVAQTALTKSGNFLGDKLGTGVHNGLDKVGSGAEKVISKAGDIGGAASHKLVLKLQDIGVDASQIKGLSGMDGTNASQTRGWASKLTKSSTDPAEVQTIDLAQAAQNKPTHAAHP